MAKIMIEISGGNRASLFARLTEQASMRKRYGEISFNVHVNDFARHMCYVFLEWESLASAEDFLRSPAYLDLAEKLQGSEIIKAIPLYDSGEQLGEIEGRKSDV